MSPCLLFQYKYFWLKHPIHTHFYSEFYVDIVIEISRKWLFSAKNADFATFDPLFGGLKFILKILKNNSLFLSWDCSLTVFFQNFTMIISLTFQEKFDFFNNKCDFCSMANFFIFGPISTFKKRKWLSWRATYSIKKLSSLSLKIKKLAF